MEAIEPLAEHDNSHHDNEELVLINAEYAPQTMRGTQQLHETPHRPGTPPITGARFPGSRFADSNITDRRRPAAAPSSPSQMEQLTQLRLDMESAELDTRIAEAQEKAARARRNTKLLDLESFNLEHKSDSLPRSHTSSPPLPASPHSAGGTHSPMQANDLTGFMALLQSVQDSALAQLQRAEERAERQEARHEAQLAALATCSIPAAPESAAPKVSAGFKSNDCFKTIAPFSGEDGQPLRPWFHVFQNTVDIARLSEDDAMRELRLKLVGVPSALFLAAFNGEDARPTILEVLACLAKDYGIPYEEAMLYAAYAQCQRTAHSSGRDYLRALTTAQRNMQAAGIPLTLSPAEQRYYMCELGLSALQRQTFLAQLSGRADVSDDYLQSLSPEAVVRRRESLLNPQDSDERRACFARRLVLIEAFLHHDLGDGKAARAAVTTGTAEDDAGSTLPATPATTSTPVPALTSQDRAARVRVLKADWQVRHDRVGPPPQYFGPNALHLAANQTMYDRRVSTQACFGCTPDQMTAAPPGQRHWECKHHGQNASPEERLVRVTGSGSGILGGPRRRHA